MKIGKIFVVLITLIAIVLVAEKFITWDSPYYERERALTQPIEIAEEKIGTIEGSLGYPSEEIPELKICAENVETGEEYCSYEMIHSSKYTYGYGYKIEVPEGSYQVYSQISEDSMSDAGDLNNYKAYYSDYVKCGMSVECSYHTHITVTMAAGDVKSGIDPVDWYDF